MPRFSNARCPKHISLAAVILALAGCAGSAKIQPEQLKEYALLIPRQNSNSIVSEVDGHSPGLSLSGATIDVRPGRHTVQTYSCYGGTSSCKPDVYTFEARAGLAYVFRSPTNIDVFERAGIDKMKVGSLHETANRVFVTDQELAALQKTVAEQAAIGKQTTLARRQRDLPAVRKIGARVCQERERGMVYIGYVEGLTDEKVQIRIADAQFPGSAGVRPSGFTPSIIWDSPMQWDLCE